MNPRIFRSRQRHDRQLTVIAFAAASHQWKLIHCESTKERLRVHRVLSLTVPENLRTTTPVEMGCWLRAEASEYGAFPKDAVVAFDHRDSALWLTNLPQADSAELSELVQCHVEMQWADRSQVAVSAYRVRGPLPQTGELSVLISAIAKDRLSTTIEVLRNAGFRTRHCGLAALSLDRFSTPGPGCTAYVLAEGNGAEILIRDEQGPRYAQEIFLPGRNDEQRALALAKSIQLVLDESQANDDETISLQQVTLLTRKAESALAAPLTSELGVPITNCPLEPRLEITSDTVPAHWPGQVSDLSSLALAWPGGHEICPVNFRNIEWKSRRLTATLRKRLLLLVMLVLVIGYGITWLTDRHAELDRRIATLRDHHQQLGEELEYGEPLLSRVRGLEEWSSQLVDWRQELGALTPLLEGDSRLYLTEIQLEIRSDSTRRVVFQGHAQSAEAILEVQLALAKSNCGYQLLPDAVVEGSPDEEFPYRFQLDFEETHPTSSDEVDPYRHN